MTIMKNDNYKIKKKSLIIFAISLFLIIISILYSLNIVTNNENKITENKIFNKLDYYIKKNDLRYTQYKKNNSKLTIEQIVTHVNIGLDNDYYTNTRHAKNLNTQYILVNKYNFLTEKYIPKNLEKINSQYSLGNMYLVDYAKEAFEKMAQQAKKENLSIIAMSTYRSYKYQVNLYNTYAKKDGKEIADTYSARPGYSEHQTGLAVDVYNGKEPYTNFEVTEEFKWMEKNAYKYGYILRFPKNKTKETGYNYEAWHYRYVGEEIAKYIYNKKISYEEYYAQNLENKKIE